MNIQAMLTKKIGPLPVFLYLLAAVVGGVILWKRHQAAAAGDSGGQASTDGTGGPTASSPDSGTFQGSNSLTVNGDTASTSSAGALLTGGFVGQPGGYQFSQPAGDVFVNVPTPKQVTNVITSQNPDKDRPPAPKSPKPKSSTTKPKKSSSKTTKKVTKSKSSGSGSDRNTQKGNKGGGVSINLSN